MRRSSESKSKRKKKRVAIPLPADDRRRATPTVPKLPTRCGNESKPSAPEWAEAVALAADDPVEALAADGPAVEADPAVEAVGAPAVEAVGEDGNDGRDDCLLIVARGLTARNVFC